ncbi:MAG: metallophosphoesterase [Candidatus Krumholzibacteriia bacterium]
MPDRSPGRRAPRPVRTVSDVLVVLAGMVAIVATFGAVLGAGPTEAAAAEAIGDTLTVIQRPLLNIPAIVTPSATLTVSCAADPATAGWQVEIRRRSLVVELPVTAAAFDASTRWWRLEASVPGDTPSELYDLVVTAGGGLQDTTRNAVRVIPAYRDSWYFVHVTDPHLPTHVYWDQPGAETDSSETDDLRAVLEDLGIINPEFVLLTGDVVNEGELEDFLERRYYTRAQRLLAESEVPIYVTAGNHDLGGWDDTPPADGTARRDWWRFFGWSRLDDPPPGAPARTQDYAFDYGPVHFVSLESYLNYDRWRLSVYGTESFTADQISWLEADLAATAGETAAQVLFTHRDFGDQLDLSALGLEMMLSGHTHRDDGSLNVRPFDLSTAAVCDGRRSWRLVRVVGSDLDPCATADAGSSGETLSVTWSPANDGRAEEVTAEVINAYDERFENGLLKFRLVAGHGAIQVTGGTLLQVEPDGSEDICHVEVDIAARATTAVTVRRDALSAIDPALPARPHLGPNRPNPFNPRTEVVCLLPRAGLVRLTVHDARGREVAVLVDGPLPAGEHTATWDGLDRTRLSAPSGVYFLRLDVDGTVSTRKILMAR